MMRCRFSCFAVGLLVISQAAIAQDELTSRHNHFLGISIASDTYDQPDTTTYELSSSKFIYGYHLPGSRLSAVAQYSIGSEDTQLVSGNDVTLQIENYLSAFARYDMPLKKIVPYLLLGGTYMQLKSISDTGSANDGTELSLSFGAGVELYGSRNTAISAEYVRYATNSLGGGFSYDSVGIGFVHRFDIPSVEYY